MKARQTLNSLLDVEKLPFFHQKFINSANEETLITLVNFIEILLTGYESKISDKMM